MLPGNKQQLQPRATGKSVHDERLRHAGKPVIP
jgi:hypothetical protein